MCSQCSNEDDHDTYDKPRNEGPMPAQMAARAVVLSCAVDVLRMVGTKFLFLSMVHR